MKPYVVVLVAISMLFGLVGVLAGLGYINIPFSKNDNEQVSIDPTTGEPERCPNIPSLVKKRQYYNVYIVGHLNTQSEKILPPDKILVTKEVLDKNKLAILSINSEIRGYLYVLDNEPEQDIGFRGRIWWYQDGTYKLAFHSVPSNWNCENYPSAGDKYRPLGARYKLKIIWYDLDKQKVVDTYEQIIYVKYKEYKE